MKHDRWNNIACTFWDKRENKYIATNNPHEIHIRKIELEGKDEISESCGVCKVSYWKCVIKDN
jgi:hypothetical protein